MSLQTGRFYSATSPARGELRPLNPGRPGKFAPNALRFCNAPLHRRRTDLSGLDPAEREVQVPAVCEPGVHQDDFQGRLPRPAGSSSLRLERVPEWRLEGEAVYSGSAAPGFSPAGISQAAS